MFQLTPLSRSSRDSSRKSLNGGPPAFGNQDVGIGQGGEQLGLTLPRCDVGGDRGDLGAGLLPDLLGRGVEPRCIQTVDHHLDPGAGERRRAGAPQSAARCAHERPPSRDPQIQHRVASPISA
jgi:hypothetical protein